nr:MAG TPA: hypothetical protein [Caudoviricetes sp.]
MCIKCFIRNRFKGFLGVCVKSPCGQQFIH